MSVMIQIRNVPDELHRELKVRAAQEGKSLSEYLLGEIRAMAARPTMKEMLARLARREPVNPTESVVDIIRRTRDAGDCD